jgi:uncharacterized DUF497 family protein
MRFEWDETKNRRNRRKHGVSFETAELVFEDPRAVSILDQIVDTEERWQTLGRLADVVLLVAHTYREQNHEEVIRIFPARKATPREPRIYENPHEEAN